jgi:hypothetical protein
MREILRVGLAWIMRSPESGQTNLTFAWNK